MNNPRVFISYSHDSPEHDDLVLALSDRLVEDGIDCILDQYEESPPEGWPRWMDKHIRGSDFVIMICTEIYFKRVMGEEEMGKGLGVKWEGNLTYQHIYNTDTMNHRFIPVLFESGKIEHIPTPLQGATHYRFDNEKGYEDLYRRLTNQPKTMKPELGKLRKLPSRERKQDFFATRQTELPETMLSKLPSTSADLFGREEELGMLDAAWKDSPTNIVSVVAWGGVGKTALVNVWLNRMARENYRGAQRVYGWSFYSQGAKEGGQASADEFIAHALEWFGDPGAGEGLSPWERGVRLAERIREQRTLLILDGLEPLQYPPGVQGGRLKDPGLQSLLRELARQNTGLCILSTRLAVDDLKEFTNASMERIDLDQLSPQAGRELLRNLGVTGTDDELEQASADFGGHALALTLLGNYLNIAFRGDIRQRDKIPKLTDDKKQGAHARRVMAAYEKWFKNKPELDILHIIGLFDRPAEGGAIELLREEPAIRGLTAKLRKLSHYEWRSAVDNLRQARLLAPEDPDNQDTLDCHPLVREYFGERLQESYPTAWKQAHGRLCKYYTSRAKEYPDTIEEMVPLFAAVAHGCQSGRHQEALDDVYWSRIQRGQKFFSTKKLGAFGADLAALSGFFETPWSQPVATLNEAAAGFILHEAGFCLQSLGRLAEAVQPMQAALDMAIEQEDWKNAARDASNLSELSLTLGNLGQALDYAQQSVKLADSSGDAFERMDDRTIFADTLHQAGRIEEASASFHEAEEIQKERQPKYLLLYSLGGYRYCNLLLDEWKYHEVLERAAQTLE